MDFASWLTTHVTGDIPAEVVAFNFNLYEGIREGEYQVQLVGCASYDSDDDDWACDTRYSTGEDLYTFTSGDWGQALRDFLNMAEAYIAEAPADNRLVLANYVTAGFVDGDLVVIAERKRM